MSNETIETTDTSEGSREGAKQGAISLQHITDEAMQALDARSRDIILRRFGLKQEQRETLESIGKEYGITRERVRQIESNAKKALADLDDIFTNVYEIILALFAEHGGVLTEQYVADLMKGKIEEHVHPNYAHFYLVINPQFDHLPGNSLFGPHWRYKPKVNDSVDAIVVTGTELLKAKGHPVPLNDLIGEIQRELGTSEQELPTEHVRAVLIASKHICPTAFGEWGLAGWAETSPRGVGDKAYAVLRRHQKPAHFRDITHMINEAAFDKKVANPQTVHNELIKDNRFVLVGRGLYGLKEWGFRTGTVADVLESILKDAQRPLTREELIDQVLKQRMVKKNTILLSLQNSKRFVKNGEDGYTLKQA